MGKGDGRLPVEKLSSLYCCQNWEPTEHKNTNGSEIWGKKNRSVRYELLKEDFRSECLGYDRIWDIKEKCGKRSKLQRVNQSSLK